MSEKGIETTILCYLRAVGIFTFKIHTTGIYDVKNGIFRKSWNPFVLKGVSDILGLLPSGRMLAIEIKTPRRRKNVSEEQQLFIDNINKNAGLAFVATSVDDVIEMLKGA